MPSLIGSIVIQLLLIQAQLDRMAHTPIAYADTVPVAQQFSIPLFKDDPEATIRYWANYYGQNTDELYYVIKHEGGFHDDYTNVVGAAGERGACQILPTAHRSVTLEQMLSPDWCIAWTAKMWQQGHAHWWTTHWIFEDGGV